MRLLLEKGPDVEREVPGICDGSTIAAFGVEVFFERGLLHELVIHMPLAQANSTAARAKQHMETRMAHTQF